MRIGQSAVRAGCETCDIQPERDTVLVTMGQCAQDYTDVGLWTDLRAHVKRSARLVVGDVGLGRV